MSNRILFVDDDQNLLSGIKRLFRREFDITTADTPEEGIQRVTDNSNFAVVISDFRMPNINGVEFLSQVRQLSPNSVRIMLTGQADIDAAIGAINDGNIFRFLNKPCPDDKLRNILNDAIQQYNLITSEKTLLEETLNDSLAVLLDVLALTSPLAFSHSNLISKYANSIIKNLNPTDPWQFKIAAKLSQIGCVSLPNDLLQKVFFDEALSIEEAELFNNHPKTGKELVQKIPRLETVAEIIQDQLLPTPQEPFDTWSTSQLGAQILRAASHLTRLIKQGISFNNAKEKITPSIHQKILDALHKVEDNSETISSVSLDELSTNMTFEEDICADNNFLLITKGQPVTFLTIQRLKNFQTQMNIPQSFKVRVS